jgi:hypothetical protein
LSCQKANKTQALGRTEGERKRKRKRKRRE